MNSATDSFVLRGAHVIDSMHGINRTADVHVTDGTIAFVGTRDTLIRYKNTLDGMTLTDPPYSMDDAAQGALKAAVNSLEAALVSQPMLDALVFVNRVTGLWPSS